MTRIHDTTNKQPKAIRPIISLGTPEQQKAVVAEENRKNQVKDFYNQFFAKKSKQKAEVNPSKTNNQTWEKTFTSETKYGPTVLLLQRHADGSLYGLYRLLRAYPMDAALLVGKLLQDDDVYLESPGGAKLHGKFDGPYSLVFGDVFVPGLVGGGVRLSGVRFEVVAHERPQEKPEVVNNLQSKPVQTPVQQPVQTPVAQAVRTPEKPKQQTEAISQQPVKQPVVQQQPVTPKPNASNTVSGERVAGPWNVTEWAVDFVAKHEALRTRMYNDAAGYCTIGYGHLVHKGKTGTNKTAEAEFLNGITEEKAKELLITDLGAAVDAVNAGVKVALDQRTFEVLVDLTFNLGVTAFGNSDLLKRLNMGDYDSLYLELQRFNGVMLGNRRVFSAGLYERRHDALNALPADSLDVLMGFDGYTAKYTLEQLRTARDLIAAIKDDARRGHLFGLLQRKVHYHSQRDNATPGVELLVGYKIPTPIPDLQCNVTSLAMALETIGIYNPDPKNFPQYEDYLEHLGAKEFGKNVFARSFKDAHGWPGLANLMGAKVRDLSDSSQIRKRQWWRDVVLPELKRGNGVMFSIYGHIVRVQDVVVGTEKDGVEGGLVVDDPFGARINMGAEQRLDNYGWGMPNSDVRKANANAASIDVDEKYRARGDDNFWDWKMVEARPVYWVAVIEKGSEKR